MRDIYHSINNFDTYRDVESKQIISSELTNPYYTIFIPTYKRAATLKTTIESAVIQKCTKPFEIVIVNNDPEGAEGETRELIESFHDSRISYYVNRRNIGLCGNWNRGIELARGEYISMIHDDDMLSPWFLQSLEKAIHENADPYIIGVSFINFDSSHMPEFCEPEELEYRKVTKESFFFGRYINIAGMTVKKSFALQQGGYRDEYYPNEDSILIYQAVLSGNVVNIEHTLAGYRQEVNLSLSEHTMLEIIRITEETRRMIAKHERFANRWMRCFDKEYLYSYIKAANSHWNHNLDCNEVLRDNGFNNPKVNRIKVKLMNVLLNMKKCRR